MEQNPHTPTFDRCGAHWILRAFAITITLLLFLVAFGLMGRMDKEAEAATLSHNTCISALVLTSVPPTTSTTPEECT